MARNLLSLVILAIILSSCEKDPPLPVYKDIKIEFVPTLNGKPLIFSKSEKGPNGLQIKMDDFRFLISEIKLKGEDGISSSLDVAFIDFPGKRNSFLLSAPKGKYNHLSFGLGVSKSLNGIEVPDFNPASYPISHPLSIYNGMYWNKETGYVFLRIEGKIDTSKSQTKIPDYSWFYHIGTDTLYGYRNFSGFSLDLNEATDYTLRIGIEFNDLFINEADTINMVKTPFSHTTDNFNLAAKILSNMRKNMRLIDK